MIKLFHEIKDNRPALVTLVGVNVKTTVSSTRLGWLWWLFNPLITMGIYYFFVNVIMQRGGDNYHLFVLTGIVAWQFFAVALAGSTTVIINNKQLIRQVALPATMLVTIPPLVQLFFGAVGISIVMLWNYPAMGLHSLAVIPLLLLIAMVAYGFGLYLAVIIVYIKDTKKIIAYILRAGFFLSPVLFPASRILESPRIPEIAKFAFALNPMSWIITALRTVVLDGALYNWKEFFLLLCLILLLIQIGLFWIRENSSQIIKML